MRNWKRGRMHRQVPSWRAFIAHIGLLTLPKRRVEEYGMEEKMRAVTVGGRHSASHIVPWDLGH